MSIQSIAIYFITILTFLLSFSTFAVDHAFKVFNCSQPSEEIALKISEAKKQVANNFKKATLNRCLPVTTGLGLPVCSQSKKDVGFLDSRFPTVSVFVHYIPGAPVFIVEILDAFHGANPNGIANIMVSTSDVLKLISDQELKKKVDQSWVNIIPIIGTADYAKWTRDIFRSFTKDGKPGFFHLNYGDESDIKITDNTPCELSRQCGIPYFVHRSLTTEKDPLQGLGIDSGGNLGAAPAGVLYRGTIATPGFNDKRDAKIFEMTQTKPRDKAAKLNYPVLTPVQKRNAEIFRLAELDVVNIDTSFLYIGHADEAISILKTHEPPPCDFAILRPSLNKAFQILNELKSTQKNNEMQLCKISKLSELKSRHLSETEYNRIADMKCIDGMDLTSYMARSAFRMIADPAKRTQIDRVLKKNAQVLSRKVSESTGCTNPKIIEVPTLFEGGKSVLPNQVNLLELTSIEGKSNAIVARSYFGPFDRNLETSLKVLGIDIHFVNDLEYALEGGDVHCGTNEIRLCKASDQ